MLILFKQFSFRQQILWFSNNIYRCDKMRPWTIEQNRSKSLELRLSSWKAKNRKNVVSIFRKNIIFCKKSCLSRIILKQIQLFMLSQCDQIRWFIALGQLSKAGGKNYFAQITHIFGNFCKGFKIFHCSSAINFGQNFIDIGNFFLVTLILTSFPFKL